MTGSLAPLTASTVLKVAPNTLLALDGDEVSVRTGGAEIAGGPFGLAVLDAFQRPVSFAAALIGLKPRILGERDFIALTSTIHTLYQAGVLVTEGGVEAAGVSRTRTFDSPQIHTAMLNDTVRTRAYLEAIAATVRKGDVVVDLGAGTGILAMAAARAGAARVYAIEAGEIGETAHAQFAANGLADRITLVRGWSTKVSLPERADVLVSEIIGNDPFGENVLESTHDACRRHVKAGARLLPSRIRLFALPVTIPDAELDKRTYTAADVGRWSKAYGFNFSALAAGTPAHAFNLKPQNAAAWRALAPPLCLADIDLSATTGGMVEAAGRAIAAEAGRLDGVLLYFELDLGPGQVLSTHPAKADSANHWQSPVWLAAPLRQLSAGDAVEVTYRRGVPGRRDGVEIG